MEEKNNLGIYLAKHSAHVVCFNPEADHKTALQTAFTVSDDPSPETDPFPELAEKIAKHLSAAQLKYSEVFVALDSNLYMQHKMHSEFTDVRQLAATIGFDVEEAIATDATQVALAFQVINTDETGSDLTVFTAAKDTLASIIAALQAKNLDPGVIEPDINSLSRCLEQTNPTPDQITLFALLGPKTGYLLIQDFSPETKTQEPEIRRTFLLNPSQDRTNLLSTQLPVTMALPKLTAAPQSVHLYDSHHSLDLDTLRQSVSAEIAALELPSPASSDTDPLAAAIALGTCLKRKPNQKYINFRFDFMPYLGKKMRLERNIRLAGIAATYLIIVAGIYLNLLLIQANKPRKVLTGQFEQNYADIMGKKMTGSLSAGFDNLKREVRKIESLKSGQFSVSGEQSISAKLTMLLDSFNKCAAETDLNIERITITGKSINIVGDTNRRSSTLKLFETVKADHFDLLQSNSDIKSGRDVFNITLEPKTQR